MYDYQLTSGVRPEEFPHVLNGEQENGWSVEQIFQRQSYERGPAGEVLYDVVFKRPSKDISYAQMLINRYDAKLREVQGALAPLMATDGVDALHAALGRIGAEIERFLFEGSPEDM